MRWDHACKQATPPPAPASSCEEGAKEAGTLRAWIHWVKLNPKDEDQLAHALATESIFDQLTATRAEAARLREVREKLEAIEKLGAMEYEGEPACNIQAVIAKEAIALLDAALGKKP
jgi:hypothetical protein